jgi:predicted Zn-dependent protease
VTNTASGFSSLSGRGLSAAALAVALLLVPSWGAAREGVEVGSTSRFARFAPAAKVEQSAQQQYQQLLQQAVGQNALAGNSHPQLMRLRAIAQKIIPYAYEWNPRAKDWKWEINLLGSKQVNAFCMPGGKIAFYSGILDQLKLTDDEVAMVMGHEIAHALREHARERLGKAAAANGVGILAQVLGAGQFTQAAIGGGSNLLMLNYGREDESESDLIGMELAARAGFNPQAGVSLWQKMGAASKGAPPQFLSTHPSGPTRIADMQNNMAKVMPLYKQAISR